MICIGLDLAKAVDYSAIAVVVRTETTIHTVGRERWQVWTERKCEPAELIHIERIKKGTSFTEVVKRVTEVATHKALGPGRKRLVVDATGLGSPVMEMVRGARTGCELKPVVITGGTGQRYAGGSWNVSKADLMAGLRTSMELQDLLIAAGMAETPALVKELTDFGGAGHDDMVMALALALWGVKIQTVGERSNVRIV